eukprot:366097-Chlamydomonas_euryale.AAC.4
MVPATGIPMTTVRLNCQQQGGRDPRSCTLFRPDRGGFGPQQGRRLRRQARLERPDSSALH